MRMLIHCLGLLVLSLAFVIPAAAQETTTYTYDALGRLIEVNAARSAGDDIEVEIDYDDAGNRTSYEATGDDALSGGLLVLPITGDKVVVIPQP